MLYPFYLKRRTSELETISLPSSPCSVVVVGKQVKQALFSALARQRHSTISSDTKECLFTEHGLCVAFLGSHKYSTLVQYRFCSFISVYVHWCRLGFLTFSK